jgi:nucleotide-binding universal stress UspA family protein
LIAAPLPSSVPSVGAFQRVLVALDFTASSARVLDAAASIVGAGGALRLLHVVEWMPAVAEGGLLGYGRTDDLRVLHEDSERRLAEAAATLEGRDVTTEVVEGKAAGTILDVADEWSADLVVLGARRRPGDAGLRTGGVIERLLKGASCAVLVVPA